MIVMKRMGVEGGDDDVGICMDRGIQGDGKGTHKELHGLHECGWQSMMGDPASLEFLSTNQQPKPNILVPGSSSVQLPPHAAPQQFFSPALRFQP